MTDPVIKEARERVVALKPGCAVGIRDGYWDNGALIRDAVADVLRDRKEAEGE